jgi:hypothetical protein
VTRDPARPGQKPGCNPLTFFLLKRYFFDFLKKIEIDLDDPVTRSKPGDPVKTRTPGLKLGQPLDRV